MSDQLLLNRKYWADRAEEARVMAGNLSNKDAAAALLEVARWYDRLAEIAKRSRENFKGRVGAR